MEQRLFQLYKMGAEIMDTEIPRAGGEVGIITIGAQFQNVAEVVDSVVDRCGGEKEYLFFASSRLIEILL